MKANKTTSNPYKPGDIVTTTWGYSMTLVGFYEVVRVTPSKVELRELEQKEEHTGYLSGYAEPLPGKYATENNGPYSVKPGQLCKVRPDGVIIIPSYPGSHDFNYAGKWSGKPRYFNHCD